jgi:hypothetical protein
MPPFFFHLFFFFFFFFLFLFNNGWSGRRTGHLVVAQPPQWPKGVVEPPLMPPFFFHVFFFFFFLFIRGWSGHPLRPLGWLGHHQTGRSGGGPATPVVFFSLYQGGGPATPLGHWGGWATTRPAGLVVAQPPQWPKGWSNHPLCHPSFFFFWENNKVTL